MLHGSILMTRILTATCVGVTVLCVFQARALRDLKAELASVDARARRAAVVDLHGRRDEVLRVLTWMDASWREGQTPGPSVRVCSSGALDVPAVGKWLFDVYLLERAKGRTEVDARQRVVDVMHAVEPAQRLP
jgi:hypothetical protein